MGLDPQPLCLEGSMIAESVGTWSKLSICQSRVFLASSSMLNLPIRYGTPSWLGFVVVQDPRVKRGKAQPTPDPQQFRKVSGAQSVPCSC